MTERWLGLLSILYFFICVFFFGSEVFASEENLERCRQLLELAQKNKAKGEPYFRIPTENPFNPSNRDIFFSRFENFSPIQILGKGAEGMALRYEDQNQKNWDVKTFWQDSSRTSLMTLRSFERLRNLLAGAKADDLYRLPQVEAFEKDALRWPSVVGLPLMSVLSDPDLTISPYVRTAAGILHEYRSLELKKRLDESSHPYAIQIFGHGFDLVHRQSSRNWGFVGADNIIVDPFDLHFTIIDPH